MISHPSYNYTNLAHNCTHYTSFHYCATHAVCGNCTKNHQHDVTAHLHPILHNEQAFNQKQINSILKINAENFLDGWIKGGKLLSDKDKDTKLDLSRKHTKQA